MSHPIDGPSTNPPEKPTLHQYPGQPYPAPPYSGQAYPAQPSSGQPSSGQPSSGQPSSGQPYPAQPSSGQPYPAQPYSAQPYSGPPVSETYAYGAQVSTGAARPEKRGRAGIVILSILTALFLVAAGVLGTLLVIKTNEARRLDAQVTRLNGEVTSSKNKIDTLQKDLTDAKGQVDEITNQKKVIVECVNAIQTLIVEAQKANGATTKAVQDANAAVQKECKEADKFL
jgi:uncharacterized membrane protein